MSSLHGTVPYILQLIINPLTLKHIPLLKPAVWCLLCYIIYLVSPEHVRASSHCLHSSSTQVTHSLCSPLVWHHILLWKSMSSSSQQTVLTVCHCDLTGCVSDLGIIVACWLHELPGPARRLSLSLLQNLAKDQFHLRASLLPGYRKESFLLAARGGLMGNNIFKLYFHFRWLPFKTRNNKKHLT